MVGIRIFCDIKGAFDNVKKKKKLAEHLSISRHGCLKPLTVST